MDLESHATIGEPSSSARLCAVALALWYEWAKQYRLPADLLTVNTEAAGSIDLMHAAEKALAAFRAQHGYPDLNGSPN